MALPDVVCYFANIEGWGGNADGSEYFYIESVMTMLQETYDTVLLNPTDPDAMPCVFDVVACWLPEGEMTAFLEHEGRQVASLFGESSGGIDEDYVDTHFDIHHRTHHWLLPISHKVHQYPWWPGIRNVQDHVEMREYAVLCNCHLSKDDMRVMAALMTLHEDCGVEQLLVVGWDGVLLGDYAESRFNILSAASLRDATDPIGGELRMGQKQFFDMLANAYCYIYPRPSKRGASIPYAIAQGVPVIGDIEGDYRQFLTLPGDLPHYNDPRRYLTMARSHEVFFAPKMARERYLYARTWQ